MNIACRFSSRRLALAKLLHSVSFASISTRSISPVPLYGFVLPCSRLPESSSGAALSAAASIQPRATCGFTTSSVTTPSTAHRTPRNVIAKHVSARTGTTFNDLSSLQVSLAHLHLLPFQDALWAPVENGEIWMFRNGAIVCWNLEDERVEALTKATIEKTISALIRSSTPSDEGSFAPATYSLSPIIERVEREYCIDPSRSTSLDDGAIILGTLDTPSPDPSIDLIRTPSSTPSSPPSSLAQSQTFSARYALSAAIAHHLALCAFERSIDSHYQRMQSYFRYRAMMHPELQRRKGEGDLRLVEPAAELLHMRRHFAYGMGVVVDREGLASAKEFMGEVRKTVDGADESMKELVDMLSQHLGVPERLERLERKLAQSTEEAMLLAAAGVGPAPDRFVAPGRIVLIYAALCVGLYYFEYGSPIANDSPSKPGSILRGKDVRREGRPDTRDRMKAANDS